MTFETKKNNLSEMGDFKAENITDILDKLKRGNEMNYNKNSVVSELNGTLNRAKDAGLVTTKQGLNGLEYENNTNPEDPQSQKMKESGVKILFPRIEGIVIGSNKMNDFISDISPFKNEVSPLKNDDMGNNKNTSKASELQIDAIKRNLPSNKPYK